MMTNENTQTNHRHGLEEHVAALLCYLNFPLGCCFPILSGIFLFIERSNRHVRFHAWQATFLSVAYLAGRIVLGVVGYVLGQLLSVFDVLFSMFEWLWLLGYIALGAFAAYQAYHGLLWRVPLLGDFAADRVGLKR